MKQRNKIISLVLKYSQILLVLVGVYCALMTTATRLEVSIDSNILLAIVAVSSVLFFFVFHYLEQFPAGHWIGFISLSMLFVVFLIRFFVPLRRGFTYFVNCFMKRFMDYSQTKLNLLSYANNSKEFTNEYCATLLIGCVAIFLVAIISMSFYRHRNAGVYLIATLPFVALPLIVGNVPYYNHCLPYLMATLATFATGQFRDETREERVHQKVSIIVAIIVGVVGAIAFFICPPARYNANSQKIINIKNSVSQLANWSNEDMVSWFQSNFSANAIDYGKVGTVAEVKYTGKKLMQISVTQTPYQVGAGDGLYLKSYLGDLYKDGKWDTFSSEGGKDYDKDIKILRQSQITPDEVTNKILKAVEDTDLTQEEYSAQNGGSTLNLLALTKKDILKVKNIAFGRNNNVQTYVAEKAAGSRSDGTLDLDESVEYEQRYYSNPLSQKDTLQRDNSLLISTILRSNPSYSSLQSQIQKTNEFVKKYYCAVPEGWDKTVLREFLVQEAVAEQAQNTNFTTMQKVKFVQQYLLKNMTYTLSPGVVPQGKEPIDYFLNTSKKGYCVHFATAATMMLRSLGVPCRYVEGVQVSKDEFKAKSGQYVADVLDRDAHAWVEVYYDGIGFMPEEMTPGDNDTDETDPINNNGTTPAPQASASPTPTATAGQNSNNGASEEQQEQEPVYSQVPEESMEFEDDGTIAKNERDKEGEAVSGAQINGTEENGAASKVWAVLRVILIIVLIVVGVQGQVVLRNRHYKLVLKKANNNQKAQKMYRHIKPLLRSKDILYKGQSVEEYIDEIAVQIDLDPKIVRPFVVYLMKAYYAGEELDAEEMTAFRKAQSQVRKSIWRQTSLVRKFIYRYVFGV